MHAGFWPGDWALTAWLWRNQPAVWGGKLLNPRLITTSKTELCKSSSSKIFFSSFCQKDGLLLRIRCGKEKHFSFWHEYQPPRSKNLQIVSVNILTDKHTSFYFFTFVASSGLLSVLLLSSLTSLKAYLPF